MAKQNFEVLLQDEEGTNYTCMVSPEDYNRIIGGGKYFFHSYMDIIINEYQKLLETLNFKICSQTTL